MANNATKKERESFNWQVQRLRNLLACTSPELRKEMTTMLERAADNLIERWNLGELRGRT